MLFTGFMLTNVGSLPPYNFILPLTLPGVAIHHKFPQVLATAHWAEKSKAHYAY